MKKSFQEESAIERFLQKVYNHGFIAAVEGMTKILEEGPAGREKKPLRLDLHQWYQSLDESSREKVRMIVRESVKLSVFSTLVVLDNAIPGPIIEGEISDIAIYVQTYKDQPSQKHNETLSTVRINHPNSLIDLHDRFTEMLRTEK